uniref:Uncharacterized protein n=1 Tax=Magallana gigas TaxID=29159 RepID=A0A8W8NPQ3_MAGGI
MPALTTDSAKNTMNAELAGMKSHKGCTAHKFNLAKHKGLQVFQMEKLLPRTKRVVTYFHKSSNDEAPSNSPFPSLDHPGQTRTVINDNTNAEVLDQKPDVVVKSESQAKKRMCFRWLVWRGFRYKG